MKNPVREFFYIPKNGKVSDKKFARYFSLTVMVIFVCMASMALTAYAFYSADVADNGMLIKPAHFDCTVTITDGTQTVTLDNGTLSAKTYTVNITRAVGEDIADNGFCAIKIGDDVYHTTQLVDEDGKRSVTFTLVMNVGDTVSFTPMWGTSSHYASFLRDDPDALYIADGDTVVYGAQVSENENSTVTTPPAEPEDTPATSEPTTDTENIPATSVPPTTDGEESAESSSTTTTRDGQKVLIVSDLSQMQYVPGTFEGGVNSTAVTSADGSAVSAQYVLQVDGGETLLLRQNLESVTLQFAIKEFKDLPLTQENVNASGQTFEEWLTGSVTLQSDTKYIVIGFRNGDGTADFTEEQLQKLPECLYIGTKMLVDSVGTPLNVRASYGTEHAVITTLNHNTPVLVLSVRDTGDVYPWANIVDMETGKTGWVFMKYLKSPTES